MCKFRRKKEEEIVLKFIQEINKGNIAGIHNLMSKDHIFIDMGGDLHKGKKEINWKEYFNIFPDYKINIEKILHKNNNIYILGNSTGNFSEYGKNLFTKEGKTPQSEDFQGPAIWRAKIENQKVKEWQIFPYNKNTIKKSGLD